MQLVIAAFATGSRDRTQRRSWSVPFACLFLVALLPLAVQGQTKTKTKINPIDGAEMVWIPAGEFLMGSTEKDMAAMSRANKGFPRGFFADQEPQHRVYLDGYWIYKYEVSVGQYRKFCKATHKVMPMKHFWDWKDIHPIVKVSWNDATAYAKWARARLPTEAQWEKAARGTDGRRYPWGNKWDETKCANSLARENPNRPKPIGSYPGGISPYGVYDMAGNVWEWSADRHDERYYRKSPRRNPIGPASGGGRVLRGGALGCTNVDLFRCCYRSHFIPTARMDNGGFRCVQGEK
ncbi:MAG: SUMF1/EgtB/PvdO family nonheme iron enzyme [Armatimonadetes bacterium]|nr:SUMF1/EgtB/PvdO family nonheme iron enzyme [Armatimonadota bacterium]